MKTRTWITAASSVRGKGHEQTGAPCQDSSIILDSADGQWVALVASDGAGTAEYADVGSTTVAKQFADALIQLASRLTTKKPGEWVIDSVLGSIIEIRTNLRSAAATDNLKAYHCTLVACLIGPTGGFAIHIGDGAIFGGVTTNGASTTIDLSGDIFVSAPHNGEYANETVFITERDWIRNLRIQPIPKLDWVMLGTDGGMALAMSNDTTPKTGFVAPVLNEIIKTAAQGKQDISLENILSDKQADRLTNDDKTLVVAIKRKFEGVSGEIDLNKIQLDGASIKHQKESSHTIISKISETQAKPVDEIHPSSTKSTSRSKKTSKINWYLLIGLLSIVTILTAAGTYQFSKRYTQELHTRKTQSPPINGDATNSSSEAVNENTASDQKQAQSTNSPAEKGEEDKKDEPAKLTSSNK
jgi:hypothetical protein